MNSHSPKENFVKLHKAEAESARSTAPTGFMQKWVDSSLAELAHRGCSSEELNGVNRFIAIFLNLGDPGEEPKPAYPVRDLKTYQPKE